MYISSRAAQLRNISLAIVNGTITLIILLIAPLGLAAVLINTLLVTFSTYLVSTFADRVIAWLLPSQQAELLSEERLQQQRLSRSKFLRRANQRRNEP